MKKKKDVTKRGYVNQPSKYKYNLRVLGSGFEFIVTLDLLDELGAKRPKSRNPAGDYLMHEDEFVATVMQHYEKFVINYGLHNQP